VLGRVQTNDLFVMNQDRMEWIKLEQHGAVPGPRDGHCAAYDDARKQVRHFNRHMNWSLTLIGP
jgi:hypothetical protein